MSRGPDVRMVVRVDQSPMNPKRWCITLDCGHEPWVTANKRPKRKTMRCPVCADIRGAARAGREP